MDDNLNISQDERALGQNILDIGDTLINAQDNDIVTMDEHRFVAVFLPMFAGDEVQHYREYGVSIGFWQQLAGSPFKEVRIVDRNGVELYRVPPLFNVEAIKPLDGTGQAKNIPSIADMLARANLIAKQGPAAYDTYMKSELERRSFMFKDKKDEHDYITRWNEIFKRYNRPLINLTADANGHVTASNNPTSNTERPIDFDSTEFESF